MIVILPSHRGRRLSQYGWLVTYRDGLSVHKSKFLGSKIYGESPLKISTNFVTHNFNTIHSVKNFAVDHHRPLKRTCTEFLANFRFLSPKNSQGRCDRWGLGCDWYPLAMVKFWGKEPLAHQDSHLKNVIYGGSKLQSITFLLVDHIKQD